VDKIQEAYAMSGDANYPLKAVVPDLKDLSALVNNLLLRHASVARVRSAIVLERLKDTARLPLRAAASFTPPLTPPTRGGERGGRLPPPLAGGGRGKGPAEVSV
jgi:hypothetical protein